LFGDCLDFFAKKVAFFWVNKNQFSLCLLAIVSPVFGGLEESPKFMGYHKLQIMVKHIKE